MVTIAQPKQLLWLTVG